MRQGDRIGFYRVVRRLGAGGMGEVYEVEHEALGVRYALKTFVLQGGDAAFLRDRFLAEGRALARLSHPRIARVFDLGCLDDGTAYFVMDLILAPDGEPRTLADIPPADLDGAACWRWLVSMASALDAIHAEGIVHRDIKASNILLDAQGDAVLVDFGISRYEHGRIKREIGVERTVVAGDEDAARRVLLGTGGYLAPELKRGGEATAAADVYALGVTFFRLLTGLWYEPGTDALSLLEPLEGPWCEILPPMLADEPQKRPLRLVEFLDSARAASVYPLKPRLTRLAVAAGVCAAGAAAAWFCLAPCFSRPKVSPLVFDLGGDEKLEMVECRDAYGRRFWIGASHVTNGEWARVTGDAREGLAREPVVGMSMSETARFIDGLNKRFGRSLPDGARFRLPSTNELVVASTAGGANAADGSALGVFGPSLADKKAILAKRGGKWNGLMAKMPCSVRTKKPNAWGVYDIVGQGRTICRETEGVDDRGRPVHVQLGPDDIAEKSTVGEWGWNSTIRLALGEE